MNNKSQKTDIILVIDQNIQRRSNLAVKLRLMGYATEVSSSGFQAIHLLEEAQDFNLKAYRGLIITEDSEDMPGREIMLLVRNIMPSKDKFPIFYLSKITDPDEIIQIIHEGANEYIVAFENQSKIIEKISKHITIN